MGRRGSTNADGTTEQQKLFAYAYFANKGNGRAAAIEAGYSEKSATAVASRLLTYANVQKLIRDLGGELRERALVSKERIAKELSLIAFSDIRKAFDTNCNLKDVKSMPSSMARVLSSVEVDELWGLTTDGKEQIGVTKKVKLWDKLKALSALVDLYGYNAPTKVANTDADGNTIPQAAIPVQIIPPPKTDED